MTDPTITCPKCHAEIKLTESLAAPLLESTRQDYEQRIAQKDADVAAKLREQRNLIAAEEAKNARKTVNYERYTCTFTKQTIALLAAADRQR